jgi:hypothetical protein
MRKLFLGLLLGLAATAPAAVRVNYLTFNTTLILQMYNIAQQTNGIVTSYPGNLDPAIVTASIDNLDPNNAVTPCFVLYITQPGNVCTDAGNPPLIKGPLLTLKAPIPAGAKNVILNANSFLVSGNYNGEFCTSFKNQVDSEFNNSDPSQLGNIIQKFMTERFHICLVPDDSCNYSSDNVGNEACVDPDIGLLTLQPGGIASIAVLIYPHNQEVPDEFPNFIWTPALYPGLSPSDISYTLELQDGKDGEVFERVEIPAGQTFYQWKGGANRALIKGHEYCWKVKSKIAKSGQYFGGQNGQGWNVIKCFTVKGDAPDKCQFTKEDIDKWLQANGSPEVLKAIKGMTVQQILDIENDPAICRFLTGKVDITSISVSKQ